MLFNSKETAEATLSIGQVLKGLDKDGINLITGIRNNDISKCMVHTVNGIVAIGTDNHMLAIEGTNFVLKAYYPEGGAAKDLIDPWLNRVKEETEAARKEREAFDAKYQATEAWLDELRNK